MHFRHLSVVAALVLVAACGGGDDDASSTVAPPETTETPDTTTVTTAAPTTQPPPTTEVTTTTAVSTTEAPPTTEAPVDPASFSEAGPFPVGATTLQLDTGPPVEVWYPAVEGTTGTITYDVRDFTPDAIRELLTGDAPATYSIDGERDAEVADGPFPIVLFSHGSSAMRLQSSFLTSHLASHGMVVVAPDHPSRDLFNALGGRAGEEPTDSVDDLIGALDLILAAGDDTDGPFSDRVDPLRITAIGHSAGGGTVLRAALDERIGSYVSMAAGGPADGNEYPDVPSLFLAGSTDEIVTPTERTRPAFESAPAPSWYVEIAETGHNGFDDFCTFGDGTGIIGIAEASGLGPVLDAQPQLRRLGEDGCIPPAAPVELAFPIIRHTTAAFLRWAFDTDPEPVGLDPATLSAFELDVVVDGR